ncbi:exported hypothetical protein [Candidatus Zixiibacteriota bacterium]|nr:exported hypothetical protein [candidate division Zixibacteria bacterium]
MHTKNLYRISLLSVMVLAMTMPAFGQIIYGQPSSAGLQMIYSSWTMKSNGEESKLHQMMFPISGLAALGPGFEATVTLANSSNTLNFHQKDNTLNGLSDCRVQFSHSFYNDGVLLSGGLNLPVGKKKLTRVEEWSVLQRLSYDYFDFPMSRFGEGFGFNLLVGGATMLGTVRTGAGLMYEYTGTYQPYDTAGDYNPGDILSANAGADWRSGFSSFSLDGILTIYTTDKFNDVNSFKQAPQFDTRFGWIYSKRTWGLNAAIQYISRGHNKTYLSNSSPKELKIFGDEFIIGGGTMFRMAQKWSLAPSMEARFIAANDQPVGKSHVYTFGADLGRTIGRNSSAGMGIKLYTGKADADNIDLSGYQISAGINAGF